MLFFVYFPPPVIDIGLRNDWKKKENHSGLALCVLPWSLLTVCAAALPGIRELERIRCYSPRERKRG